MTSDVVSLQREIDRIDDELILLLQQRFVNSRQIGVIKRQAGQPPIDGLRVVSQRTRFVNRCIDAGLDAAMSRQLVLAITEQVIAERLANRSESS